MDYFEARDLAVCSFTRNVLLDKDNAPESQYSLSIPDDCTARVTRTPDGPIKGDMCVFDFARCFDTFWKQLVNWPTVYGLFELYYHCTSEEGSYEQVELVEYCPHTDVLVSTDGCVIRLHDLTTDNKLSSVT